MGLPGLEQLQLALSSGEPEPPLNRLTGLRLESVEPGTARFRMPLTGWLVGPDGTVPPGPLAIPADAAMACAVMSQLPAWTPFTTSEMTLRILRPPPPTGSILAEGSVIATRPPARLAEVSLSDDSGELIAHGSSLCVTLPSVSASADTWVWSRPQPEADSTPDPWQRRPPPAPKPDRLSKLRSGLELLQEQIDGQQAASPLQQFTGLAPAHAEPGAVEYGLPASGWFCAPPPGRLQGGIVTLLAEAAVFGAIRSVASAATTASPVELKINLLRPLASDGRQARASGRLVHAGRRIAVAGAEVTDADGRAIAMATGSALLTGDR